MELTSTSTEKDKKIKILPSNIKKNITQRIICPKCGNDTVFFEVARDVTITTFYIQNNDGSFSLKTDDSKIIGDINLYCGECNEDLSKFHNKFVEMIF